MGGGYVWQGSIQDPLGFEGPRLHVLCVPFFSSSSLSFSFPLFYNRLLEENHPLLQPSNIFVSKLGDLERWNLIFESLGAIGTGRRFDEGTHGFVVPSGFPVLPPPKKKREGASKRREKAPRRSPLQFEIEDGGSIWAISRSPEWPRFGSVRFPEI